ncbi:hypothetical protein [Aquifex sp.]
MADIKEEERIARLEEKVEGLSKRLDRIEARLDRMEIDLKELKKEVHNIELFMKESIYKLDKKFTILFLILIFLIIFLNQNTLKFLFQVLGFLK